MIGSLWQKGVSLIEALVAAVIIGVGFISVYAVSGYAVKSINDSVEHNQINFLSNIAAEDVITDTSNASNYTFSQTNCNFTKSNITQMALEKINRMKDIFLLNQKYCNKNSHKRQINLINKKNQKTSIINYQHGLNKKEKRIFLLVE